MSASGVHRFRTGIGMVMALTLPTAGFMAFLAWAHADGRPQDWRELVDLALPALLLPILVAGTVAVLGFQRLVLDAQGRGLRCANIHTRHRWRSVPVEQIEQVLWRSTDQTGTRVAQLVLAWRPRVRGGELRKLVLMDDRFSPWFGGKPSSFFHAVVDFIRAHNERAVFSPEFD